LRVRVARCGSPVPGDGRRAAGLSLHGGSGAGSPGGDRVTFQSVNPATGEVLETFEETAPDALTEILERADVASRDWRRRPVTERAERLRAGVRERRYPDARAQRATLRGRDRRGLPGRGLPGWSVPRGVPVERGRRQRDCRRARPGGDAHRLGPRGEPGGGAGGTAPQEDR